MRRLGRGTGGTRRPGAGRVTEARPEGQVGQSSSKIKSEPTTYMEWKAMKMMARETKNVILCLIHE